MKKNFEISLYYKKVVIEIDFDEFDKNIAWGQIKHFYPDVEKYEGTMDSILRWIGMEIFKGFVRDDGITVTSTYISMLITKKPCSVRVLKHQNLMPKMLDFKVREVVHE